MQRIYSVKINGRTLESRNLKELLARAVNTKRNLEKNTLLGNRLYGKISTVDASCVYTQSGLAMVH